MEVPVIATNQSGDMETLDRKAHWNHIYQEKTTDEVSWYQSVPVTSLDFVRQFNLPFDAKIIDIGGGDSFFVDHLLKRGYTDITVLDISAKAIERARQRLGTDADKVKWIETLPCRARNRISPWAENRRHGEIRFLARQGSVSFPYGRAGNQQLSELC